MAKLMQRAGRQRDSYIELVRRRRMYSGLLIVIFVALMASGFNVAASRNAGGFWEGLPQFFDFPRDVVVEAWDQRARLPEFLWEALPSLIETINISGTATLIGAVGGVFMSLLSTRGLAPFPRLVPVFRRMSDVMRAFPEIQRYRSYIRQFVLQSNLLKQQHVRVNLSDQLDRFAHLGCIVTQLLSIPR